MNSVILTGNLTKDPIVKESKIATFTIAWNKGDKGNFFDCIAFDKKAELIEKYCKKGNKILIRGELAQDRWQAQDGTNRTSVKIIVQDIEFLGKKEETEEVAAPVEETTQKELPF